MANEEQASAISLRASEPAMNNCDGGSGEESTLSTGFRTVELGRGNTCALMSFARVE